MSIYQRYFDKTTCMYFMIKDEKVFDKCMKIWGKVSHIIKNTFNSELIYNKIYLKAKRNSTQKKAFNVFIYQ